MNKETILSKISDLLDQYKPDSISNFPIWKTIEIGGQSLSQIQKEIKKNKIQVSRYANDIFKKTPLAKKKSKLNLVLLTVKELGFENGATYKEICDKAKSLGLELCPAETGIQLRLQYLDQPNYEWNYIAMEPITDSDGDLRRFNVERDDNDLWLHSDDGRSDRFWHSGDRFVFSLPQV